MVTNEQDLPFLYGNWALTGELLMSVLEKAQDPKQYSDGVLINFSLWPQEAQSCFTAVKSKIGAGHRGPQL
jgi:hypothetical protein